MLLDIHTHHLPDEPGSALLSCQMRDMPLPGNARYVSAGIHPWHVTEDNFPQQAEWLRSMMDDKRLIALGEAGLDKRCPTPSSLQLTAFRTVCQFAEQHKLPLIIHSVKATDELIALKKEFRPCAAWVIHGFRGNPQQAESLVKQGFYLSFGERYRPETLRTMPQDRLLIETDESRVPVRTLYRQAAALRGTTEERLMESVQETINRLFFNR